jgi:hypothetical protein
MQLTTVGCLGNISCHARSIIVRAVFFLAFVENHG